MTQKIKVTVSTGWANGEHTDYWELPCNWGSLNEKEKQEVLDGFANEYLHDRCKAYAELVEEK